MSSEGGPVSTKSNVQDLADSVELSGKRVFVRVSAVPKLSALGARAIAYES